MARIFIYFFFLIICPLFSGCITTPALAPAERPVYWGKLVDQHSNLYQISPLLYRSEQPLAHQQQQLQALGIQTIISLRSRNKTNQEFSEAPFQIIHIPINTWAIDRTDILQVMQQLNIAQQKQQKVLIHCYHGSDRTGTMIAMYRIIFEHWSIDEAKLEMKKGGYGFHPIWVNIDRLFTAENVAWIRQQLALDASKQLSVVPRAPNQSPMLISSLNSHRK